MKGWMLYWYRVLRLGDIFDAVRQTTNYSSSCFYPHMTGIYLTEPSRSCLPLSQLLFNSSSSSKKKAPYLVIFFPSQVPNIFPSCLNLTLSLCRVLCFSTLYTEQ